MENISGPIEGKQIILCRCGGERIDAGLLKDVEGHLGKVPLRVTRLADLCGLAAKKKERLAELLSSGDDCLVIGCQRRSMEILLGQARDLNTPSPQFSHLNLVDSSFSEAVRQIDEFCGNQKGTPLFTEIAEGSGWPSWYPLIDYSRCTSCGQCADFCLFGVYKKEEGRVIVTNPEGCKNNCPACARICPATAIIFPKYRHGGAIGGSDEIDEQSEQQRQAHDIEEFLGNDIYQALQGRKLKRQSIIRKEAMKKALSERDKARDESSSI
jgi:NAD-dependent dihydropyrimidine dehydrogenase PreA subunit